MLIREPQLPPKPGFVEDEDENGQRYHRQIVTDQDLAILQLQSDIDQLTIALLEGTV
jgi:hypothetical protein